VSCCVAWRGGEDTFSGGRGGEDIFTGIAVFVVVA